MSTSEKILVTGGTGFLGSHVAQILEEKGKNYEAIGSKYDLRKLESAKKAIEGKTHIIHLAANVGGIEYNRTHPADLLYDNTSMALNILKASTEMNIEKFVGIGSVCAYPEETDTPFKEGNIFEGRPEPSNAPYGFSKRILLEYSRACSKQHDLNAVHLVPTNLFGPKDDFNPKSSHVIPALIRKFDEAKKNNEDKVELWGSGQATRDFLYVEDCAKAVVKALTSYDKADPLNLSTGREISIKELANMIKDITGFKGEIKWDKSKPDGQSKRIVDNRRAKEELNFQPETSFEQGLKETYEYYLEEVASTPLE